MLFCINGNLRIVLAKLEKKKLNSTGIRIFVQFRMFLPGLQGPAESVPSRFRWLLRVRVIFGSIIIVSLNLELRSLRVISGHFFNFNLH